MAELPGILERARANGHSDLRELGADELYRREPHLGPGAHGAIEVPGEGLVCPFTTPLAYATEAVLAGCELRRSTPVTSVARLEGGGFRLATPTGGLTARYLVNAAGLHADELDRMLGHDGFTVTPRRGELIVFDKLARPLVNQIVLAVPTKVTKGVLIAPTVFGNVMLGPTADDVERKDDTGFDPGGARLPEGRGRPDHAGAAAPRGHRGVRRAARGDRARGLPADRARARGLRVRGRHPLDRPVGLDGDRRARARGARRGGPAARAEAGPARRSSGCRTSASAASVPTSART